MFLETLRPQPNQTDSLRQSIPQSRCHRSEGLNHPRWTWASFWGCGRDLSPPTSRVLVGIYGGWAQQLPILRRYKIIQGLECEALKINVEFNWQPAKRCKKKGGMFWMRSLGQDPSSCILNGLDSTKYLTEGTSKIVRHCSSWCLRK